jgi:hypothetical protein
MLKQYLLIPRILFGIVLCLATMPKAQAKELNPNHTNPTCLAEQITNQDNLNPSAKKRQINQQLNEEDIFDQDKDPCKRPKTSEATETPNETVGEPESSEVPASENLDPPSYSIDPSSNDPSFPSESDPSQPSISNQDSHNLNFSIEFGGASSGNDTSIPAAEYSLPSEPEVFLPETFQTPPSPSRSKLKQRHKARSPHQKHRNSKKPHKHNQILNHQQRSQSHQKPDKRMRQKAHRTHTPRQRQVQTHPIKGHRKEFYPTYQHNISKPTKKTPLHQGAFYPTRPKQFPHILRSHILLHPQLRQQITPARSFRRSVPHLPHLQRRR